ncbi:hypothetical protein JCM11641_002604 [Rhodosporidiobolus odoratus]
MNNKLPEDYEDEDRELEDQEAERNIQELQQVWRAIFELANSYPHIYSDYKHACNFVTAQVAVKKYTGQGKIGFPSTRILRSQIDSAAWPVKVDEHRKKVEYHKERIITVEKTEDGRRLVDLARQQAELFANLRLRNRTHEIGRAKSIRGSNEASLRRIQQQHAINAAEHGHTEHAVPKLAQHAHRRLAQSRRYRSGW